MAVLGANDRTLVASAFHSSVSERREDIGLVRADVADAIAIIDQFIEDNLAALNGAFPARYRNVLTTKQKFEIYFRVCKRRWELL